MSNDPRPMPEPERLARIAARCCTCAPEILGAHDMETVGEHWRTLATFCRCGAFDHIALK
jgi:hypothetical protein